jgi:hypothetical protein
MLIFLYRLPWLLPASTANYCVAAIHSTGAMENSTGFVVRKIDIGQPSRHTLWQRRLT